MGNLSPLPVCNAIIFADRIIVESGSNKKSLIGVYCNIQPKSVPAKRNLNLYVEVADAQGNYEFVVEIADLQEDEVVVSGILSGVVATSRLLPLELVLTVPVCLQRFGTYEIRLSHQGRTFASRRFMVTPASCSSTIPTIPRIQN